MKLILASGSPRRKELLTMLGHEFVVHSSDVDESFSDFMDVEDVAEYLANKKGNAVFNEFPDCIVIAADTVVIDGSEILGKPKDESDAFSILKRLSGKEHKVITGVSIISRQKKVSFSSKTRVSFYELDNKEIQDYIRSHEPMDKAGAYGIQGLGGLFVEKIKGDFYGVMGLPIAQLNKELKKILSLYS